MKYIRYKLIFAVSLFLQTLGFTQEVKFQQLTKEELLENETILTIAQDADGRLWFGGNHNLFYYDSFNIKDALKKSIAVIDNSFVKRIAINKLNQIFIGTQTGIYVYDINRHKFLLNSNGRHCFLKENVNDIQTDGEKMIIATDRGVYIAQIQQDGFIFDLVSIPSKSTALSSTKNGKLYCAIQNEVWELDISKKKTKRSDSYPFVITQDYITTLFLDNKSRLWVGSRSNGLFILKGSYMEKHLLDSKSSIFPSNYIRKIIPKDSMIYVATLSGLLIFNEDLRYKNYVRKAGDKTSLSQNSIYDVFVDKQHIIWVGTYYGGINAIYPDFTPFKTFPDKSSIESNVISAIAAYKDDYYIGTDENGVYKYNRKTGVSSRLPYRLNSKLVKNLKIFNDKLYITLHAGGLSIIDLSANSIKNILPGQPIANSVNNIRDILPDKDVSYVASEKGLFKYFANGRWEPVRETDGKYITYIDKDTKGNIFFLSQGKLFVKPENENQFRILEETQHLSITNVLIKQDQLWLTVYDKIYLFDHNSLMKIIEIPDTALHEVYKTEEILWICSAKGLLYYNLATRKKYLLNKQDGLPSDNLENSRFFENKNNDLFITTYSGLTCFLPGEIRFNLSVPKPYITDISIYDVSIFDNNKINRIITSVDLKYTQNNFSFEFASDNLIKSSKNNYKYRLKGFDKKWNITKIPYAHYMNVPAGDYIFQIFTANNDNVWSVNPLEFNVRIQPPVWLTWWAILGYIVILFSLLFFVTRFVIERKLLLNSKKEHTKKINFFTQISHEIRTPLTLITVPLKDLVYSTSAMPLIHSKIKRIHKNADKLLNLINELLEYRKIEAGAEVLKQAPVAMNGYLSEFFYLFSDLAISKRLNFSIKHLDDPGRLLLDVKQFDKVLFNLISNAIKYSKEGGTVFLSAELHSNKYIITIADNGLGITDDNQFKIFEEYYRDPKAQDSIGTGIGLAITKSIVEQHGGIIYCNTVVIDSEKYTVFNIELPDILFTNKEHTEIEVEEHFEHIIEKVSNRPTLLLVDDNTEMIDVLKEILAVHYRIITAEDGEQGIMKAKQFLPDLIISDVMMPVKNGLILCEELKTNVLTAHLPIILLTADTSEESLVKGLRNGANIYLQKPFNPEALILVVHNLLDIALRNRQNFIYEDNNSPIKNLSEVDQEFILNLEQIIENNLSNHLFSVDYLAEQTGLSQHILYKKLKSLTNLSVNNFIKRYRFKKAYDLLKSNQNVSEVAYIVGFADRKYFSREFKKYYGKNPSEIHLQSKKDY